MSLFSDGPGNGELVADVEWIDPVKRRGTTPLPAIHSVAYAISASGRKTGVTTRGRRERRETFEAVETERTAGSTVRFRVAESLWSEEIGLWKARVVAGVAAREEAVKALVELVAVLDVGRSKVEPVSVLVLSGVEASEKGVKLSSVVVVVVVGVSVSARESWLGWTCSGEGESVVVVVVFVDFEAVGVVDVVEKVAVAGGR